MHEKATLVTFTNEFIRISVINAGIDVTTYDQAVDKIISLSYQLDSTVVCAANVHMVMVSYDYSEFAELLQRAELVTPDGMPLKWALWLLGYRLPDRVYGPILADRICAQAAQDHIPIGLYGGTPDSIPILINVLKNAHPGLHIAYSWSPPFRDLSSDEDDLVVSQIRASRARILLVGLGCPRQERWMDSHRSSLPLVMMGVGAFFDYYSGRVRQAPAWMQRIGLEWLFRLIMEPRRLWRRYAWNNPRFVFLFFRQYFLWILHGRPTLNNIKHST